MVKAIKENKAQANEVGAQQLNDIVARVRQGGKLLKAIQGNYERYRQGKLTYRQFKRNAWNIKRILEGDKKWDELSELY